MHSMHSMHSPRPCLIKTCSSPLLVDLHVQRLSLPVEPTARHQTSPASQDQRHLVWKIPPALPRDSVSVHLSIAPQQRGLPPPYRAVWHQEGRPSVKQKAPHHVWRCTALLRSSHLQPIESSGFAGPCTHFHGPAMSVSKLPGLIQQLGAGLPSVVVRNLKSPSYGQLNLFLLLLLF